MCRSIVFLGDQFPVPGQQGLRRDNAGDLSQNIPSQCFGSNGQSAALVVIEAHSPVAELLSKNAILLVKVINDLQLALVHPAGDSDQQESEWVKDFQGRQGPLSRARGYRRKPAQIHADPIFGPYEGVSICYKSQENQAQAQWDAVPLVAIPIGGPSS